MKNSGSLIRNAGRKQADIMANEFISGSLFCCMTVLQSANPKFLTICGGTAAKK